MCAKTNEIIIKTLSKYGSLLDCHVSHIKPELLFLICDYITGRHKPIYNTLLYTIHTSGDVNLSIMRLSRQEQQEFVLFVILL